MTRTTARDDAERPTHDGRPRRAEPPVRATIRRSGAVTRRERGWRGRRAVPPPNGHEPIADLVPVIRRVVAARIRDPAQIDDIVQETLSRVIAARSRVERDTLAPYAVATARNLMRPVSSVSSGPARTRPARRAGRHGRTRRTRRSARRTRPGQLAGPAAAGGPRSSSRTRSRAGTRPPSPPAGIHAGRGRGPAGPHPGPPAVEYLLAQCGATPDRPLPAGAARACRADRRRQAELDVTAISWPATSART